MNFTAKTRELLTILENIENSYNPSSPQYKFTYVFYNIVDTPVSRPLDFPQDLWNRYYIPDAPLMPVILNKQQIEERRKIQSDLILKLAESKNGILKKLESLKFKREMVKNKLQNTVNKFRAKLRKYVYCKEDNDGVYRLQTDVIERDKLVLKERKEDVLRHLIKMKERLELFEKKVSENIHVLSEKGIVLARQLDKGY
ncbi:uncharacterized protein VICG_01926 [Vittaforma corneae ATCC 50505]|uniref:Nucleoporin Nup54 alpha-helical domain-containing protein n=1 Tax=Vittaforma corneae (strain ATCC 50505) TaxID=993615 RepID=L2GK92_VITCO|nr:uncharacterized protein VICG_01926 [Vittaforma corneae ATCC 50505]ELA41044.1 hypothetical protein VICG_01926 [Vittaforma corneae ATCC 50505]